MSVSVHPNAAPAQTMVASPSAGLPMVTSHVMPGGPVPTYAPSQPTASYMQHAPVAHYATAGHVVGAEMHAPPVATTYAAPSTVHASVAPTAAATRIVSQRFPTPTAAPATVVHAAQPAPAVSTALPVTHSPTTISYAAPVQANNLVTHAAVPTYAAPPATYAAPAAGAPLSYAAPVTTYMTHGTAVAQPQMHYVQSPLATAAGGGPRKTPKTERRVPHPTLPAGHCKKHGVNQFAAEQPPSVARSMNSRVFMLVTAIDYKCCPPPWGPQGIDTKFALDDMLQFSQHCRVDHLQHFYNQDVTKPNLTNAIHQIGMMAQAGDTFVFFYSGHGDRLPDRNDGGTDECLCTLGADGNAEPRDSVWFRDVELATLLSSAIKPGVNVIMIADCCHSGTILDLDRPCWANHDVISLSGCKDTQTSAGTGQGGEFTRGLLSAIQSFQQQGLQAYGVDKLYNMTLFQYNAHHHNDHQQDIQMNHVGRMFHWPLVPQTQFNSPAGCVPGGPPVAQSSSVVGQASVVGQPSIMQPMQPATTYVQHAAAPTYVQAAPTYVHAQTAPTYVHAPDASSALVHAAQPTTYVQSQPHYTVQPQYVHHDVAQPVHSIQMPEQSQVHYMASHIGGPVASHCTVAQPAVAQYAVAMQASVAMQSPYQHYVG